MCPTLDLNTVDKFHGSDAILKTTGVKIGSLFGIPFRGQIQEPVDGFPLFFRQALLDVPQVV